MLNMTLNTFKEMVSNKFLYVIFFFAFVFMMFSMLLWKLTIWNDSKIMVDFWLAMMEIFWLIWVLFVWSQLLFKEIEGKTMFLMLSKPIKSYEFILWKFYWFSLTMLLMMLLQAMLFLFVLYFKDMEMTKLMLFSILFTFFKLEMVLSLVFFFSTFMSNMLTMLVTMMMYMLSHSFSLVLDLATSMKNEMFIFFTKMMQLLFPPFQALNMKDMMWSFDDFKISFFMDNSLYSMAYLMIMLIFTMLIFNKKKFEN